MGKVKKSSYKKQLKAFVSSNRVVLAALGGAATGIALASIMGTEQAKKFVHTIEDSVKTFVAKNGEVGKLEHNN